MMLVTAIPPERRNMGERQKKLFYSSLVVLCLTGRGYSYLVTAIKIILVMILGCSVEPGITVKQMFNYHDNAFAKRLSY